MEMGISMSIHVSPSVAETGPHLVEAVKAIAAAHLAGAVPAHDLPGATLAEAMRVLARHDGQWSAAPASAGHDPVMVQLARALDTAGGASDMASSLYTDALRLALVARAFIVHGRVSEPGGRMPEAAPERPKTGLVPWRLKRVVAYVDDHLSESVTLADMAQAAGLSRMHFAAQFRLATGLRPHEYLLKCRIERAQQMMRETREPLVQIALAVGFQTQAHFTTVFRRFVGVSPHCWRCAHARPQ